MSLYTEINTHVSSSMVCVCAHRNWGEGWGFMPSDRALVFVDNHDNQRGHGAGGASILTFWDPRWERSSLFALPRPFNNTETLLPFTMASFCNFQTLQNGSGIYARPSVRVHTCHVKLPVAEVFCEWKSKCWCCATYLSLKKRKAALVLSLPDAVTFIICL